LFRSPSAGVSYSLSTPQIATMFGGDLVSIPPELLEFLTLSVPQYDTVPRPHIQSGTAEGLTRRGQRPQ